jgi:hypothetical protein
MRVDTTTIVGLPVKTARDLLRHLNVARIDVDSVHSFLDELHWRDTVDAAHKADPRVPRDLRSRTHASDRKDYCKIWRFKFKPDPKTEAERVFAALLAEGYLEPNEPEYPNDERKYQTSRKGRQLAAANLTKRFSRAKADQEVADLIERANQINARDELVFYVHKIHAFGSYLTDIADVGDIDLAVELGVRRTGGKLTDESHYRADNSGKTLDFTASLTYGDKEVRQLLRARKARLSFGSTSLLTELKTEFRIIFEWMPDETRRAEMEAFDWRLHEPLRQVKEWLAANPGINADPVEIARWCQEVAAVLSVSNWSDNFAQAMMPHWGLPASQAAAATMHDIKWADYLKRGTRWIERAYKQPIDATVEAQLYEHFTRDVSEWNAAPLIGRHFGWKFAEGQRFLSERDDIEIGS